MSSPCPLFSPAGLSERKHTGTGKRREVVGGEIPLAHFFWIIGEIIFCWPAKTIRSMLIGSRFQRMPVFRRICRDHMKRPRWSICMMKVSQVSRGWSEPSLRFPWPGWRWNTVLRESIHFLSKSELASSPNPSSCAQQHRPTFWPGGCFYRTQPRRNRVLDGGQSTWIHQSGLAGSQLMMYSNFPSAVSRAWIEPCPML